ncbi:MAG: hypothetical protein ACXVK3_14050 [Candidatus Angelobacter sp.]
MKYMKGMLLSAALMAGTSTLAMAQSVVPVQWGWGQRDNDDRQAFRDGFNQGQSDARHNRRFNPDNSRWRERDDRQAYRSGYERGFQQSGGGYRNDRDRDGNRDRDGDRGRGGWDRGGYGGYGGSGYGANSARQYGYQDGINDGARDRRTGHSNRPTQDSNYKHADRGYNSSFGNKDYYKQAYRQAYESGYQQGYNSGGGWRRY